MPFAFFLVDYSRWHYFIAPVSIFHIWMNFLVYTTHLFSLKLHLLTLFSPWHRVQEERSKKWDIEDWAGTLLVNIISRIIGFLFRITIIFLGALVMLLLLITLPLIYVLWYFAPVVVTLSIIGGLTLIIMYYANLI